MRKFLLNKLVRDKIVADMEEKGQKPLYRKLDSKEFQQKLAEKLREEAGEFTLDDKEEALKELADVLEVVETLAAEFGASPEQLKELQTERKAKRGGFEQKLYVESLELADDDPWADYYASDPTRFKEVK